MNPRIQLFVTQMGKLEQLVRRSIQVEFSSASQIWNVELDLINYQVELQNMLHVQQDKQKAIKQDIVSVAESKLAEWKLEIQKLRLELKEVNAEVELYHSVLAQTRKLGDALAWLVLGGNQHHIFPLTENMLVNSTSTGPSLQGVLAIAELLSSKGLGFPIIHDMTSILRVGDISFVSAKHPPITVEVKTRPVEQEGKSLTLQQVPLSWSY